MHYTVPQIQEYHRLHYPPNNVVGIIVGDFESADAKKLLDKYWGQIPSGPTPPQPDMFEIPQHGERRVLLKRQAELPMLFAAYHIPPETDPDIPALEVLSKVLSHGQSSRLYQRLVYKEQAARFAGGSVDDHIGPSIFMFYLGMKQGKPIEDGEKSLWEEVERLRNESITENELIKAKNQNEAEMIGGLSKTFERAQTLGEYEIGYGDYKKFGEEADAVSKVTAADVQRVAKKYLDPDQRTVLIVVPTQETENADPATMQKGSH